MKKLIKIFQTIKKIKKLKIDKLKKYKIALFFYMFFNSMNGIYSLLLLKFVIKILSIRNIKEIIIKISFLLLISLILDFIINYFIDIYIPKIEEELSKQIDLKIIQSISELSVQDYDHVDRFDRIFYALVYGSGSIIDFEKNIINLIGSVITTIGILFIIGYYKIQIILVVLIYIIINVLINLKKTNLEYEKNINLIRPNRILNYIQRIMYTKSMIKDLKIFRWNKTLKGYYTNQKNIKIQLMHKYGKKELFIDFLLSLFEGFLQLFIITVLAIEYLLNKLDLGDFLVVYNGIIELCDIVLSSVNYIPQLYKGTLYIDYIDESKPSYSYKIDEKIRCIKSLSLNSLNFSYDDKRIISDFNYTFEVGKKYVIIGENGTGKSTLVNLISGFYDSKHIIKIDGLNIDNIKLLNSLVSGVFQNFQFNAFTIGENLIGNRDYRNYLDEIYSVLDDVGLKERIERLPLGLNSYISNEVDENGTEFSGGELQRLAIARMLLNMKDIIVLDEPFSALDHNVKNKLLSLIFEKTKGKILIFITHDMSIIDEFDEVIRMEG